MKKRILSILLCIVMVLGMVPVTALAADAPYYVVAGFDALCGTNWNGTDSNNIMTENAGVFTKVYTNVAVGEYQLKVVKNNTDGSQQWIGDDTGNNVTFNVTKVSNVTVTYTAATNKVSVSGEGVSLVTELAVDRICAVGNGNGNWLNGVSWDPADTKNQMTEIREDVYQIKYTGLETYDNYQFKFAANGSWADNWGCVNENGGEITVSASGSHNAVYNGQNIILNITQETADVTLTLDLSQFNYATKAGALITVDIAAPGSTVSFNANGGTGTMTAVNGVSGNYTLPSCTFTAPAGKQFKGWATAASGTVISGTTYNVTENVTFYAIWEDLPHTHGNGTLHTGTAANCATQTNGEKDYYICSCGDKFFDAACTQPVSNAADLVIPWEHTGTAEWTKTATTHKKAYTCCGAVVVAEEPHELQNYVCTECGHSTAQIINSVTLDGACLNIGADKAPGSMVIADTASYTLNLEEFGSESGSTITEFKAGKTYLYGLSLKAKAGYAFAETATITINGVNWIEVVQNEYIPGDAPGYIVEIRDSLVFIGAFTIPGEYVIETIDTLTVTGVSEPVIGRPADYSFAMNDADKFDTDETYLVWAELDSEPENMVQVDNADWYGVEDDLIFDADKYYVAIVIATPKEDYQFQQDEDLMHATINGKPAIFMDLYPDYESYFYLNFGKPRELAPAIILKPETAEVTKGTTKQFVATMQDLFDDSLVWRLEGATSADTKLEQGLLTVGADETATTLYVHAISNNSLQSGAEDLIYDTAVVTVKEPAPVNPNNPAPSDPNNPTTGDESQIFLWLSMMAVSACAIAAMYVLNVSTKKNRSSK